MKKSSVQVIILVAVIAVFVIGGGFYFYQKTRGPELQRVGNTVDQLLPTETVSPSPPLTTPITENDGDATVKTAPKTTQTYTVPIGWQKYTDAEAGITIYYPSGYIAKYNPNRGVGINYSAGSYLLDPSGQKVLDFYKFPYNGGSRREAFYDVTEFDGPEDMSKFTVSTTDVKLNNRTYLKLMSSYWTKFGNESNRVFFLTPQGNQMFYFTYSSSVENKVEEYKNVLTIIATSILSGGTSSDTGKTTFCYSRPDSGNKGMYWDSYIDGEGNMVVVQRTDKSLKQQNIDKTKIEIAENPQTIQGTYRAISDFDISIDSSQKGNYKDAFVIKVKKKDVDSIASKTPSSIPSVAIYVSISGGVETSEGEVCKSHLYGYYAPRP